MLSFKPTLPLSSFSFIKRLFSSSSLSAIRVVSSAYLSLLIFLPAILIPACASSSPAFLMMYCAYKLNKHARLLSDDVTAIHVAIDPVEAEQVRERWQKWGEGVRLVILDSPYRLLVEPLLEYVEDITKQRQPNEILTIVVPEFVPRRWVTNALHAQTATLLRLALLFKPGIVITNVPYVVE